MRTMDRRGGEVKVQPSLPKNRRLVHFSARKKIREIFFLKAWSSESKMQSLAVRQEVPNTGHNKTSE